MPLETRASIAAERLLILTEALNDAVLNDRFDEVAELLASRQEAIDLLGTMEIDAPAQALLTRVMESERDLYVMMVRSREGVTQELVQLYSGARQVRAYSQGRRDGGMLRTG